MDSLQEILGKKGFTPPNEISAIKDYIRRKYQSGCGVRVEKDAVILSLPSSALAANVQLEKSQLINALQLKKKLIIRNGR